MTAEEKKADVQWQAVVCHLAGNRCEVAHEGCTSGAYNGAHHIIGRDYKKVRYNTKNGIACCPSCHAWIHSNPLEFMEWLEVWYEETFNTIQSLKKNYENLPKCGIQREMDELKTYCRKNIPGCA